ncbi:uncharacterized protein LOC120192283 [Hibiscus syriacus]|uniref:uncharacterized protein LOC120192283 n=1 Tax=Hibiscus syriacus TaxID=106335 RepID=UPI0019234AA9|nr:uncharacterized protein LOC120192283 [Hibiscus syriacus]
MEETADESSSLKRKREAGTAELNDEGGECETETMSELLKLVDDSAEVTVSASSCTSSPTSYGTRVRFSDNPYSSALIFQSSSYITINGNEESCGSSFSESESSVMASIEMGGIWSANVKVGNGSDGMREWLEAEEDGGAWVGGEFGMERRAAGEVCGRGVSFLKFVSKRGQL